MHDPEDKSFGEAKPTKKAIQERPLDRVKSFPKVHFEKATRRGALPAILPEELLNKVDIITHKPITQKSILEGTNNILQSIS